MYLIFRLSASNFFVLINIYWTAKKRNRTVIIKNTGKVEIHINNFNCQILINKCQLGHFKLENFVRCLKKFQGYCEVINRLETLGMATPDKDIRGECTSKPRNTKSYRYSEDSEMVYKEYYHKVKQTLCLITNFMQ